MADLIAIGYPDETTAFQAEEEAQRLGDDPVIQLDALSKYGGTVLKSSLTREAEAQLHEELHGSAARQPINV